MADEPEDMEDVEGVGASKAEALRDAGYGDVEALKRADQDDLSDVEGVGPALAARIKADVGELEVDDVEEVAPPEGAEEDEEAEEEPVVTAAPLSDKTPELDDETRRALQLKSAGPGFERQDHHKKKRVPTSWRDPPGSHSRLRKGVTSRGASAGVGHGSPAAARGLHPSGFEEVLVHRPEDLDDVDADTQAARIAGGVGGRKRERIEERALADEIRVLNPTHPDVGGDDG